jgi:hypothetical protein
MLLSRFWYVVMAVALGAVLFVLFLSTTMFDRSSVRSMGEALAGDSQVVASYLRDDARKRSISLIVPALDDDIRTHLSKSSASPEKIPSESKEKVRSALRKLYNAIPAEQKFDAMFAVDQAGRVVGQVGFDQASGIDNFELGGYPVVADALHGWIRDDSWVLGGRIYRVVVRPVEHDVSQAPAVSASLTTRSRASCPSEPVPRLAFMPTARGSRPVRPRDSTPRSSTPLRPI